MWRHSISSLAVFRLSVIAFLAIVPVAGAVDEPPLGGDGDSTAGATSADGRYVVFVSAAGNLVTNDANDCLDVFLRDRQRQVTTLVSTGRSGTSGNGNSTTPTISGDGRYVAFASDASDLVESDGNKASDIFLFDGADGSLRLVSRTLAGASASGRSEHPLLSFSGDVLLFTSTAPNIVSADWNGQADLFLYDIRTDRIEAITVNRQGTGTGVYPSPLLQLPVFAPAVSDNGRFVAFQSIATDLVANDSNAQIDVFVRDRWAQTTRFASFNRFFTGGGNAASFEPLISPDGRFVAFRSLATNLVSQPVTGSNWYLADMDRQIMQWITNGVAWTQRDPRGPIKHQGVTLQTGFQMPSLTTSDGLTTVFSSPSRLNSLDANSISDVFLNTASRPGFDLISVTPDGLASGNGPSSAMGISPDGRYVVFSTSAANLFSVPDSNGTALDTIVRDVQLGVNHLVTINAAGTLTAERNMVLTNTAVLLPGPSVLFTSTARDLVATDTNSIEDVFLWTGQTNRLISINAARTRSGNSISFDPRATPDGRFIVFTSRATDLVAGIGDLTGTPDLFLFDTQTDAMRILSLNRGNTAAARHLLSTFQFESATSSDGRFVAYTTDSTEAAFGDSSSIVDVVVRDVLLGTNILVSVSTNRTGGNFPSSAPRISPDGRFVGFVSRASNLVPNGTTNEALYIRDLQRGTTVLAAGGPTVLIMPEARTAQIGELVFGTGLNEGGSISRDGVMEVFTSSSLTLVTNGISGSVQVFARNRQTQDIRLVSMDSNQVGVAHAVPLPPCVSPGGNAVLFDSYDSAMVAGDFNRAVDVFLHNLTTATTELISLRHPEASPGSRMLAGPGTKSASRDASVQTFATRTLNLADPAAYLPGFQHVVVRDATTNRVITGLTANGEFALAHSGSPQISPDGSKVVFISGATNLVTGDRNQNDDVFVHDLRIGTTRLVSGDVTGTSSVTGRAYDPDLAAGGQHVVFVSTATALTPLPDANNREDVFVRNLESKAVTPVSVNRTGTAMGNLGSRTPRISSDGLTVAFVSFATDLTTDPVASTGNIFLRDLAGGVTMLLAPGIEPPFISDSGQFVAFVTSAALSAADMNSAADVHLYDRQQSKTVLLSRNSTGVSGDNKSTDPVISANDRFVVFTSHASDLAENDANRTNDVFRCDLTTGAIQLVSVSASGKSSGDAQSDAAAISPNGRFVAFRSWAADLAGGTTPGNPAFYVRDMERGITTRIASEQSRIHPLKAKTVRPAFTSDGTQVILRQLAPALIPFETGSELFVVRLETTISPDADSDRMDDAWEQRFFGSLSRDGRGDTDLDGQSDLNEFISGTDPIDPRSVFAGRILQPDANGRITLTWKSVAGLTYRVQYKSALTDIEWLDLPGTITATGLNGEYTDDSVRDTTLRFYRVLIRP